jgi:hypothetical protein
MVAVGDECEHDVADLDAIGLLEDRPRDERIVHVDAIRRTQILDRPFPVPHETNMAPRHRCAVDPDVALPRPTYDEHTSNQVSSVASHDAVTLDRDETSHTTIVAQAIDSAAGIPRLDG